MSIISTRSMLVTAAAAIALGASSAAPAPALAADVLTAAVAVGGGGGGGPTDVAFDTTGSQFGFPCPPGGLGQYALEFGDGQSDVDFSFFVPPEIDHHYVHDGVYQATLSLTCPPFFASSQATVSVTIAPEADLRPSATSGGSPMTVTFDGSHTPGTTARWVMKFGDGTGNASGTGTPPGGETGGIAHTYAHPGTYLATLTVTDGDNQSDSSSAIITVSKAPSSLAAQPGFMHLSGLSLQMQSLTARLTRADTNGPLAGKQVVFSTDGTFVCSATTNSNGTAVCSGTIGASHLFAARANGYKATFGGDQDTLSAIGTSSLTLH